MTDKEDDKPVPSEDDVLRRMLGTTPKPHASKPPVAATSKTTKLKSKGKPKFNAPTRKRHAHVTFDMGVPVEADGFRMSDDGRITLLDKDGNSLGPIAQVLGHFREREGKDPKPVSRIPLDPAKGAPIDPNVALFEFERVVAFDTNTADINGESVSVAGILQCELKMPTGRMQRLCLDFANANCPPDFYTLSTILRQMERWPIHPRVAFVTDWDIASHAAIQARERPVLDDLFLPEWATLLFATSDASDHLVNQLLRLADKQATSVLDAIKRGDDLGPKMPADKHVNYVRFLMPKTSA